MKKTQLLKFQKEASQVKQIHTNTYLNLYIYLCLPIRYMLQFYHLYSTTENKVMQSNKYMFI